MSISEEDRKNAPYHAGPHDSFPVEDDGGHLKAAWDLAGHAKHPDQIRAHLKAFARKHNIVSMLPQTAKVSKSMQLSKATSDAVQALLALAFHHEEMEGDTGQQRRLTQFAADNGLTHLLPEKAHGMMHSMEIPHKHGADAEPNLHSHPMSKAFNPITQEFLIQNSYTDEDGYVYVEGYISPITRDKEKHSFEPEAFQNSLGSYFARLAPVSTNHGMQHYPVGHMQKAALVRDGKIFKTFDHPTDSQEFKNFKDTGSGWYGRIQINDAQASDAIQKGNLGGFSWTGNANKWIDLPDGGKRFTNVNHVMEATVAAYPVNGDATIALAKAFGLEDQSMANGKSLEEILAEILVQKPAVVETPVVKAELTPELLTAALGAFKTEIMTSVTETVAASAAAQALEVKKAIEDAAVPTRKDGAGRQGQQAELTPQEQLEENPVEYLVKKAKSGEALTEEEAKVMWGITKSELVSGMKQDAGGDNTIMFSSY